MRSFWEDLDASRAFHGHLCSGMVLGIRMARLALGELGIADPVHYRDLVMLPALLGMAGRQREGAVPPFALRWRA